MGIKRAMIFVTGNATGLECDKAERLWIKLNAIGFNGNIEYIGPNACVNRTIPNPNKATLLEGLDNLRLNMQNGDEGFVYIQDHAGAESVHDPPEKLNLGTVPPTKYSPYDINVDVDAKEYLDHLYGANYVTPIDHMDEVILGRYSGMFAQAIKRLHYEPPYNLSCHRNVLASQGPNSVYNPEYYDIENGMKKPQSTNVILDAHFNEKINLTPKNQYPIEWIL